MHESAVMAEKYWLFHLVVPEFLAFKGAKASAGI